MSQILPFDSSSAIYTVGTVIEGEDYIFDIRWNVRDSAWYMDIFNAEETILYAGIKIVLGAFLGFRCVSSDMPAGVFWAIDTAQTNVDAGYDDLGTRVQVMFVESSDFNALLAL